MHHAGMKLLYLGNSMELTSHCAPSANAHCLTSSNQVHRVENISRAKGIGRKPQEETGLQAAVEEPYLERDKGKTWHRGCINICRLAAETDWHQEHRKNEKVGVFVFVLLGQSRAPYGWLLA